MEKGEEMMAEPESITRVLHAIQDFKRDFPNMAKEVCKPLEQVWILGTARTFEREDRIRLDMAKHKLEGAVSSLRAAMVSLGHTAKIALEEGNLSSPHQEVCEVLYEIFVPERTTLS